MRLGSETAAASAQAVNATQTRGVEYGTWHVRFCELTGCAGFLIPYYSEAHSGQARTRSSGARASSRGAPRFRLGYSVRGMRGHGVKEQCVRGHFKEMLTRANHMQLLQHSARCKGSGILVRFFFRCLRLPLGVIK